MKTLIFIFASFIPFCSDSFSGINAGGGGRPGGANTQVQYNDNNRFGGVTNAVSDGTTLSLTSPKIVTSLLDSNGNVLLGITPFASAVNHFVIANREAGQWPALICDGPDTDIGLALITKGENPGIYKWGQWEELSTSNIDGTYLALHNSSIGKTWQLHLHGSNDANPGHLAIEEDWIETSLVEISHDVVAFSAALKLTPLSSPPSSPSEGWIYAGADHHLYYYNGTTWKQLDN